MHTDSHTTEFHRSFDQQNVFVCRWKYRLSLKHTRYICFYVQNVPYNRCELNAGSTLLIYFANRIIFARTHTTIRIATVHMAYNNDTTFLCTKYERRARFDHLVGTYVPNSNCQQKEQEQKKMNFKTQFLIDAIRKTFTLTLHRRSHTKISI